MVLQHFTCVPSCDESYYALNRICYSICLWDIVDCHISCKNCVIDGIRGCTECFEGTYLWEGQCVSDCPTGTYADSLAGKCNECPLICTACLSATRCTSCASGYYMITGKETCVNINSCPDGTYPDGELRTCKKCHKNCLTCIGAQASTCTSCDITKGFIELTTKVGTCELLTCADGSYLDTTGIPTCFYCDQKCRICDEESSCLECRPGYIIVPIQDSNRVTCKQCPLGYRLAIDGQCVGNG